MYRDKKILIILTAVVLTLSACASSDKLMTDTGSNSSREISKEEYLNVDALNSAGVENAQSTYKVYTLEKGVYTEEVMNQVLEQTYSNAFTVTVEVEEGRIRMGEYLVDGTMVPIEEGETIATIYTEVDEVAIEEAELNLTRLRESYQRAYQKYLYDLEELYEEKEETGNKYKKAVIDLKCEQRTLDWEKAERDYKIEIEEAEETLSDLKESSNTTEIKAEKSGYVVYDSKYSTGTELENGDYICHIMTTEDFYFHTANYAHQFSYGMNLNFSARGNTWSGSVINAGSRALYGNLDTGETYFSLTAGEEIVNVSPREMESMTVEGNAVCVENVVLVPKDAVTVAEDNYYVTVLKEDGGLLKTEFLPGGENTQQYWVYDGLTEGMQIIYQ